MNNKDIFLNLISLSTKILILIFLIGNIVIQLSDRVITPIKKIELQDKIVEIQNDLITLVPNLPKKEVYEVSNSIKVASEVTKISDKLITSVAYYESKMNKNAKSPKGYKGIMQATKHDVYEFAIVDVIRGSKKLEEWIKYRNGNIRYALASYNGGTKPPKQSFDYADKIINLANQLNNNKGENSDNNNGK
jgi:soluble lytic murein transglycosylase-like protein